MMIKIGVLSEAIYQGSLDNRSRNAKIASRSAECWPLIYCALIVLFSENQLPSCLLLAPYSRVLRNIMPVQKPSDWFENLID